VGSLDNVTMHIYCMSVLIKIRPLLHIFCVYVCHNIMSFNYMHSLFIYLFSFFFAATAVDDVDGVLLSRPDDDVMLVLHLLLPQ
jgi:hypothetical protein